MGFDPEKDRMRREATRQKLLETGLRVFAEKTIDAVNLTDIAKEAGYGMATVYRYFNSKQELVLAIGTWMWQNFGEVSNHTFNREDMTAAEELAFFLDSFIVLYQTSRDVLRFNQFFNIYVQREGIPAEDMRPYMSVIELFQERLHKTFEKGKKDGTLRADIQEKEAFSTMLHLMLAAVTRYAVGLVYESGTDPEKELLFLRNLLLQAYRTDSE